MLEEIEETTESPSDDAIADLIQLEMVAHVAWTDLPRKGKGSGKKSGKGHKGYAPQGRGKGKFSVRKGSATLEERRKKLQVLKASTKCHDCGERGHWSGDPQCLKGKGKGTRPTASLAVSSHDYQSDHFYADEHEHGPWACVSTSGAAGSADDPRQAATGRGPAVPGHLYPVQEEPEPHGLTGFDPESIADQTRLQRMADSEAFHKKAEDYRLAREAYFAECAEYERRHGRTVVQGNVVAP